MQCIIMSYLGVLCKRKFLLKGTRKVCFFLNLAKYPEYLSLPRISKLFIWFYLIISFVIFLISLSHLPTLFIAKNEPGHLCRYLAVYQKHRQKRVRESNFNSSLIYSISAKLEDKQKFLESLQSESANTVT